MMSAQLQQQQQKQQQDQQQKQQKQQNQAQHQLSQQQLHQSLPSRTGSGSVSANASIAPGAAGSQIPGAPATSNTQQPASFGQLRNRAAESQSPYVRVHAKTPVAWQLLNADTLKRAQAENKPIFMHIGFLADHHCRLTTQDSFSNNAVAAFLNSSFIPVIIDRDERPDLDTIYQNYSEAVNATGGWPLNLFLTPDLYPIFGGTYWPGPGTEHSLAAARGGTSGVGGGAATPEASSINGGGEESYNDFLAIAKKIHKFWVEQEERCRREAFEMLHKLQDFAQEGTFSGTPAEPVPVVAPVAAADVEAGADLDLDQLDEALDRIFKMFDPVDCGFGTPKFPNPARLSFLLRLAQFPREVRDVVGDKEVENAASMARSTLRRIRDGGLRDHVGAGFMRFSVTSDWSMPHFEKMVGENALLLGVYLDAWLGRVQSSAAETRLSLEDEFADVVIDLADYLTSPLIQSSGGGFITSEAADSFYRKGDRHMREGAYYLWTRREFDDVVGPAGSAEVAAAYWNVLEDGNIPRDQDPHDEFINQNVLCSVWGKDIQALSKQFGIPVNDVKKMIAKARERLRAHREQERPRPARDEKVVVGVNGMVISALARTAAVLRDLDKTKSQKYLEVAQHAATFIKENLWVQDGTRSRKVLKRFWFNQPSDTRAFADDYAFLIEGLLDLYEATLEVKWLVWAKELQDVQSELFYDTPAVGSTPSLRHSYTGGFYSTEEATLSHTILRLKSGMDKSQPSTNAVSASNLFRLGTILDEKPFIRQAIETINAFEAEILQYPWLFVSLLAGVVTLRLGVRETRVKVEQTASLRQYWKMPKAGANALLLGADTRE
ncbi:uncharacterized protein B0T23DRAFT_342117 [Neurospora hispaniola]|uniref:Spermatogenesis-associated protein 20-like TRX domain-containing protein n=1 Tax=Neurospora hispaniola TaxID=588809 RepID=A0AAJ0I3D8_9PEZI|nr:hypothetical protein B0T23DRAFT_342117 [Neurospora hispaniola]